MVQVSCFLGANFFGAEACGARVAISLFEARSCGRDDRGCVEPRVRALARGAGFINLAPDDQKRGCNMRFIGLHWLGKW